MAWWGCGLGRITAVKRHLPISSLHDLFLITFALKPLGEGSIKWMQTCNNMSFFSFILYKLNIPFIKATRHKMRNQNIDNWVYWVSLSNCILNMYKVCCFYEFIYERRILPMRLYWLNFLWGYLVKKRWFCMFCLLIVGNMTGNKQNKE